MPPQNTPPAANTPVQAPTAANTVNLQVPTSVPPTTTATANGGMSSEPKQSGSKLWLVLIGVVVLLLLIGGGVLYYLNTQQSSGQADTAVTEPEATPVSQVDDLNKELDSTEPGDVDSEFQSADKDLQSL